MMMSFSFLSSLLWVHITYTLSQSVDVIDVYSDYEQCYLQHCPNFTQKSKSVTTRFHNNLTIPSTCLIGHGHAFTGGAKQYQGSYRNRTHNQCRHRGINKRRYGPKSLNNIYDLFLDTLLSKGFQRLILLGDSVTIQFGNFLSCDYLRAGFLMKPGQKTNMFRNSHLGGSDIISNPSGNGSLEITSFRVEVPCISTPCSNNVSEAVMEFAVSEIWKFLKTPGTIVVFNCGLHFHRNVMGSIYGQIQAALAGQMLELAKLARSSHSILGFRETTVQHFQSEDGMFEHVADYNSSEFCCVTRKTTRDIDVRDKDIVETLNQLDPDWRKSLAWFKFHKHSEQFYDKHVEVGVKGMDCTHYVYDVDMSIGLLQSILDSVIACTSG
jgi:hypothetical protein